ncbi:AAA family ATPase [Flavivirga spongiicola]|uniref:AAA family ATPase n=1 Tax=Flavivirga spongiicola TaxID=421621 RepID=A0ABU7XMF2_9FLAO|nr:AAA family ATPase [Flavivirga sp. MEBiC05379]MDO5981594.1 AAA family ATPase [Flavivirga sp. MEBiC05379]
MIYLQRSDVKSPKALIERAENILEETIRVHQQVLNNERIEFGRIYYSTLSHCKADLRKLFRNKCAYCETSIVGASSDIDAFRPKSRAINTSGKAVIGYYWLALEWHNLYNSCQQCNRYKNVRFPVKGHRLEYPNKNIYDEQALLLDPCDPKDWNEIHFEFLDNGQVVPLTEKGRISIEVLGLNRENLIYSRKEVSDQLKIIFKLINKSKGADQESVLIQLLDSLNADKNHLAVRRQFTSQWLSTKVSGLIKHFPDLINKIQTELQGDLPLLNENLDFKAFKIPKKRSSRQTKKKYNFEQQFSYDIKSQLAEDKRSYYTGAKLIERVEIINFKGIKSLHFKFPQPEISGAGESWMLLIGRNSTGKSSVLQAISLALIGQENLNNLEDVFDARKCVRRATGVSSGHVKVWMTNFNKPFELHFNKRDKHFTSNIPKDVIMLLAYGSTRILPIKHSDNYKEFSYAPTNVKNLFDPQNQLRDVESWLGSVKDVSSERFKQIKTALFKLLDFDPAERQEADIYRRNGVVKVKLPDGNYLIRELCDGYQSVIAYSLDIMITLFEKWDSIEDAEGIVLIDEIGVHLHPSWKIKIVSLLRRIFPRTTFIVTTHDPLCLRPARKGEIHIMSRNLETNDIKFDQVDIPPGTPVERLYTGMWFAMDGTLDPGTSKLMQDHRNLVLAGKTENAEAIKHIENTLEKRLKYQPDGSLFGQFREVLGEVLDQGTEAMEMDELKEKLKAKLKDTFDKA